MRTPRVVDDAEASEASADFDLFINGTYLSKAINRAPIGYYYVHFPGEVPTRGDQIRSRLGVVGVKALSLAPRLPQRLTEVQAAFDRRVARVEFVPTYTRYLANSQFTASWVERLWGRPTDVLYPPVRASVRPGDKAPLILVLGRFFDPSFGHSKKQHELLATFRALHKAGRIPGWRMAIVGGCDAANREYALEVKRSARGLPVEVHVNAAGSVVERLLGEASIYWHGAGLGEDAEHHPERFEHFGISVVEAMAAGAVPLVFGAAGPAEIVHDGIDGRQWIDARRTRRTDGGTDRRRRTSPQLGRGGRSSRHRLLGRCVRRPARSVRCRRRDHRYTWGLTPGVTRVDQLDVAHHVDDHIRRTKTVEDRQLPAGAELEHHEVRHGLTGKEVQVRRRRPGRTRRPRRQETPRRGVRGGHVGDDRRGARRDAADAGNSDVPSLALTPGAGRRADTGA